MESHCFSCGSVKFGGLKVKKRVFIFVLLILLLFNSIRAGAVEQEERKWQDETIYYMMIDRFNNGDQSNDENVKVDDPEEYHGGDFQGIIDKLDYIKEMGFTAIVLTPIFDNAEGGYHGYWTQDFYQTEEHFGSIDVWKQLVAEAHKRDMKVILEFVISHVSSSHPWVHDDEKKDWLQISEDSHYMLLNLENPEVREYITEAAKWWIEETSIDGYQLHSIGEVPHDFISYFSKEIKSIHSNVLLLGDMKINDIANENSYIEAGLNGVMNDSLSKELRQAFREPDQSFTTLLENTESDKNSYEMGTFLDNADHTRFTRDMVVLNEHPGPRWKQALTFLYSTPGIPIVYYGSEIALDGGEAPDNHRQMNFRTYPELAEYIAKIGQIRSSLPSLTRGDMDVLYEKDGFVIFKREYENETSVVAINNTTKTQSVAISADELQDEMELRGRLNGDLVRSQNHEYTITIDRDESEIYVLSHQSGLNYAYLAALGTVLLLFGLFLFLVWRRSRR